MASSSRPLSPHLQIYRRTYTMVLSISHRATGLALSVGFLLLAAWLVALATGPVPYARLMTWLCYSLPGIVVIAALTGSFWYHFCCGIRHLVFDTGRGLERRAARLSGAIVVLATVLLTLATLALILNRLWSAP